MKTPEESKLTLLQQIAVSRKLIEAEIIARAWADEDFRAKLEADPAAALREAGLPLPEGKTLRVIREEPGSVQIILPPKPVISEISDDELEAVAGGGLITTGKCRMWEEAEEAYASGKISKHTEVATKIGIVFMGFALYSWGYN